MAKLTTEQAPAPYIPKLFLLSAVAWGMAAGLILLLDGEPALASRWGPATLALVHALTLGFLGNAMLGSLLQFLPVAVGVMVRGGQIAALLLHALFNLGALALVLGFHVSEPRLLELGALSALAAFGLFAVLAGPGLLAAVGQRFLRVGISAALLAGLLTALQGSILVLGLTARLQLPLSALTDTHAAWGVLGWGLGLLAAVARVVAPMFQGLPPPAMRWQVGWQLLLYVLLIAMLACLMHAETAFWARGGVGVLALMFAGAGLLQQGRAPRLRRVPLTFFWMLGIVALAGAALLLLLEGAASSILIGALAIGIALPLLVTGMALEITAFLGWLDLQRGCGRGVRLPGVQILLPAPDKYRVLAAHGLAAVLLISAVAQPGMAAWAGAAVALAHLASFAALAGVGRRCRQFKRQQGL